MKAGMYFVDDEPALAQRLGGYLERLGESLRDSPAVAKSTLALVLSGGYGRGEGGVFRDEQGTAGLYNDLEFYMLLRTGADEAAARAWCERHEREGTVELGIDVEFKRLPIAELRNASPSMFYYDLMRGNRLIYGQDTWSANVPKLLEDAAKIPLHEATRLLFNRGTGLFFSRCALAKKDDRVTNGFVERNHNKVRIALGDAVLAANGQYHHFCRERNRRIVAGLADTPPNWKRLVEWHTQGTAFKLSPRHTKTDPAVSHQMQAELATAWLETLLWLESKRLGRTFQSASAYAHATGRLFPEIPIWKNIALRMRDKRSRGGALPHWMDYPRGALLRVLVSLVDPDVEPDARVVARGLSEPPPAAASDWTSLEPAYERWWAFYN